MLPVARVIVVILVMLLATTVRSEPLDKAGVERFVDSMGALQARESYFEDLVSAWQADTGQSAHPGSLMLSESVALMQGRESYETLDQVARDHGFEGAETWGVTGDRILLALMALTMGDMAPAMQRELAQVEQQIAENPRLSDKQKKRMGRMLKASKEMMARMSAVTEADQEAVRPYMEGLTDVLDYNSGN